MLQAGEFSNQAARLNEALRHLDEVWIIKQNGPLPYIVVGSGYIEFSPAVSGERDSLISNEPFFDRKQRIDHLITHVKAEYKALLDLRACDGTGLLYRSTLSYLELLTFCTEVELRYIHDCINPVVPFVRSIR